MHWCPWADPLSFSYIFSFVSSTRCYIKVSGRTKPAFALSSNRSEQSLSPKLSINFFSLENHFSVEVIPVFDHAKAYIYSIFSCEGQDFLHWRTWILALIFVFLHMRDFKLVFVLRGSTNYFIFLTVFCTILVVFLPYWLHFEKIHNLYRNVIGNVSERHFTLN